MTTITTKQNIALSDSDLQAVGSELQAELAELIDLSLNAKQAHWNVVGPNFRSVHLQLDEILGDLRAWSDTVAERLSTMGILPDGRSATVARTTGLSEMPTGEVRDSATVELFSDYLREFAARSRQRAVNAGVDPVSQDILHTIIAGTEQHQWMLRTQSK